MRRALKLSFIFLFFLSQAAALVWFCARPLIHFMAYEKQLQKGLLPGADKSFIKISLDKKLFQSERKDDNEIEHSGRLFDIICMQFHGDSVQLVLQPDDEENSLLKKYDQASEWYRQTHPGSSQTDLKWWKWMQQLYDDHHAENKLPVHTRLSIDHHKTEHPLLSLHLPDSPFQPPRL